MVTKIVFLQISFHGDGYEAWNQSRLWLLQMIRTFISSSFVPNLLVWMSETCANLSFFYRKTLYGMNLKKRKYFMSFPLKRYANRDFMIFYEKDAHFPFWPLLCWLFPLFYFIFVLYRLKGVDGKFLIVEWNFDT